jgi:hypothetical protein
VKRLPALRHPVGALGLALYALALWQRIGYFSFQSAATLILSLLLLGLASAMPERDPGRSLRTYPLLFLLLLPLAAVSTPGGAIPGVELGFLLAIPVFIVTSAPPLLRLRLPLTAAALLGAHTAMLLHLPVPHGQDVFRFLNHGVDALLQGRDPYVPVPADGADRLTYPPGVLLLGLPFRVLFGDVRWGYLVAEAASVALLWGLARRLGRRPGDAWIDALILLPMALPRLAIAYFDFSNHDLTLVPLALAGLLLALPGGEVGAPLPDAAAPPASARPPGPAWRPIAAGVVLGIGIAAKQYFIVFPGLFLAAFLPPATIVAALLAAAALVLPFLAWSPGDMLHNLFSELGQTPDVSRLTAYSGADRLHLAGGALLRLLGLLGIAITLALAWLTRRDLGASLRACGIALAAFAFCAPFAAYNYYGYAFWFLCCGLLIPSGVR